MKRREFFWCPGGRGGWPLAVRAQQRTPVIGYLASVSPIAGAADLASAFRRGLAQAGFTDGRNVIFEYRYAEGQTDRLQALAASELVGPQSGYSCCMGGSALALAAKPATTSIPIIFTAGDADPVEAGLVSSL